MRIASKEGRDYCSPIIEPIDLNNCLNKTDQKVHPVVERYKSFLQRLAQFKTN